MYWTLYWIMLSVGIAATGVFLFLRVKKGGIAALYAKAVASLCFISTAFAATNANRDFLTFGSWMSFGLVLGMLGDVWLDLKWIYLQDKDSYLYSGFISFLLGHICFNVALYMSYDWTPLTLGISIAAAIIISLGNLLMGKPLKMNYGKFKLILFLYTAVLAMTMVSSIIAAIATGFQKVWVVMAIGGILFTLSDAILSGMFFGENKNTKPNIFANHFLYYAAQFCMAATILCIK